VTLLTGELLVHCPKIDMKVDVKKQCASCPDFKHASYRGLTVYVACSYGEEGREETETIQEDPDEEWKIEDAEAEE